MDEDDEDKEEVEELSLVRETWGLLVLSFAFFAEMGVLVIEVGVAVMEGR